jgi:uncharacterized protein YqjF (DUF2071 family)
MIIIGFTGPAGCGKDTAAMALVRQLGFSRMSFAAPIKEALDAIFGWTPAEWQDRIWKEAPIINMPVSPRQLAQTLGTEWGRDTVDPDFWVKVLEYRMYTIASTKIVISDVRFPNEAMWIRSKGGHVVDVTRNLDLKVAPHSSEMGLEFGYIDARLPNEGGAIQLEKEAVEYARELLSS